MNPNLTYSGSPTNLTTDHSTETKNVSTKTATKSKPRKRVNTAEKRHQHNAIERQRRETLNGKFISLARLLPSLASHRRPSKSAIVNGSINHLTYQRGQRLLAASLLRKLCAEHDDMLNEINEWRKANGFPLKESTAAFTDEVDQICGVEKEVFGDFSSFDENDNDDNDNDGMDDSIDIALEHAKAIAAINHVGGLVTPRNSTDMDPMQAQAMFAQTNPNVTNKRNASVNGMTWSNDFAFSIAPGTSGSVASSRGSLPFTNFMSDSFDHSSSTSPSNSGNAVLTPPMTADANLYQPTPSPQSSVGLEEKPTIPTQTFSTAEMQFFNHAALNQRQRAVQPQPGFIDPTMANPAYGLFAHAQQQQQQHQQQQPMVQRQADFGSDAFTQSLLASMFPANAATQQQVEEWRKVALGGMVQQGHGQPPSMEELRVSQYSIIENILSVLTAQNAVRTGMGLGMGMAGAWHEGSQNHAVEGF